jgi:hypothetical protein
MPGSEQYPKDRVAQKSYESGGVEKSGNAPKDVGGKESMKTGRAGGGKE